MIKEQKKYVDNVYSTLSGLGLLAANLTLNFLPGGNILFLIMSSITGGMLINDILSSKWEKIFKNIGVYNSDKQFPKHIRSEETGKEIKHTFSIPVGVSIIDFYNAQKLLESALCSKIKIENEGNKVIVKQYKTFDVESKWETIFKNAGLRNKDGQYPQLTEVIETKIGNRFIFKLPPGFCLEFFQKYKPIFETAFRKPLKLELTKDYELVVQIFDVKFKKRYKPKFEVRKDNNLIIPLGVTLTIDGEKEISLNFDEHFHTLIGGINGSGKTTIINIIITWACLHEIEVKLLDMKFGGDYGVFEGYKNLTTYINDADTAHDEAEKELRLLEKIQNDRATELKRTKCKNYKDYNKKYNNSMKPLIFIIDEFIELSDLKNFNKRLNKILAKARATNIKIILAIQRACHENLKTTLKANLNTSIAFMTKNNKNSEILLDDGDTRSAEIRETGEAILKNNKDDFIFKGYYLTDKEIEKLIKPYCSKAEKVNEVVEDSRIISLVPKTKQIAALEKNKVVDLL